MSDKVDNKRPTIIQATGPRWKRRFGQPQGLVLQNSAPSTCHTYPRGGNSVTAPVKTDLEADLSNPNQLFGLRGTVQRPGTAPQQTGSVIHLEQHTAQREQLGSERAHELPSTSYGAWQVLATDKPDPCTPFGTPGGAPAAAFCPVCGLYLQDIADSTSEQLAHISSCSERQDDQSSDSFFDAVSEVCFCSMISDSKLLR